MAWYRAAAAPTAPQRLHELSVEQIRQYEKRWQGAREP